MAIELEKLNIVITSEAKEATNALDSLIDKLKDIREALGAFSANTQGVKSNTEALQASLNGTTQEAKRVASGLSSASASANSARASLRQTGASAKQMGDSFHTANGKVGKLFTTIKRVATMRLIRWAIRQVVNAAKEGLEILVEWDRTFGNNTSNAAKTVDELSAKWRELKKSVGAALMPIIQVLQPLLNGIMNLVIGIFNTINQIVRAVQGYSTYMKATEISTKNTVSAAKELRRVLFGFDELNVLNGSGGTGAAGSVSPIEFKETKITQDIKDFFKGIDTNLDVNPYLNPQVMEETDTKIKDWLKKLFNIKDEDLKALDEKIMGFFGEEFTKLKEGWDGVVENWHNALLPIKTWLDTHISIPLRQAIAKFYAWILEKHPKVAKFLGITDEKLEEVRVEIKAIVEENEQLDELYAVTHYKGKFNVNVNARSDLDSNTKKLLELINTGLTEKYIKEGTLKIGTTSIQLAGIKKFAEGGIPDIGTLFYAGESGAEVVASSPSGTGVMNVKQMQDAVSNGNVQVVNAVGAIGNMIVAAINNKDMNAYLDGQMITDNVLRRANGMARATGQPVLVR